MLVKRLPNGQMGKKNSVFVAFYTDPVHLYQSNEDCRDWGHKAWFAKISLLGYVIRWNGVSGFVGGQVDGEETLLEAAKRECEEEVGYKVDESQLTLFCSHRMIDGTFEQNTHVFACKVSVEEMYKIRSLASDSRHGRVEGAGFVVVHMGPDAPEKLLSNTWAGTAIVELKLLLESGLIPKAVVEVNDNPL